MLIRWEDARTIAVKTIILIIIKPERLVEMSQRTNIREGGKGGHC